MSTEMQVNNKHVKDVIQATIGIYPVTSLGVSFYHYCGIDLLICRKNGVTSQLFANEPILNIKDNDHLKKIHIENGFTNGMVDALNKKVLPTAIICTPPYDFIDDMVNELTDVAVELMERDLLKSYTNLKRFYFPTIILASNGIIYDEVVYSLQTSLQKRNIPELIIKNIYSKIVRASIMQGAYRNNNIYFPHKKGLIKIALPKFPLFSQVVDLLNSHKFTFSIHTNPHRIEFEKAMVNIATNAIALVFALDQKDYKLKAIDIKKALAPDNATHATFVKEVQLAIFEIGKKAGAFSEIDTFEKVWYPRKEQILKHDSPHITSSLHYFKNMIQTRDFPDGLPPTEYALTYPLKCFAKHYQLHDEVILLEELEKMISSNINFARKHAKDILITF